MIMHHVGDGAVEVVPGSADAEVLVDVALVDAEVDVVFKDPVLVDVMLASVMLMIVDAVRVTRVMHLMKAM